ncbi:MAG: hypothetical protein Q9185_002898 [Variospora sp. 1 TL-2023]
MFTDLPPVSGIQRLFASSQSQSNSYKSPHLESVTEESHTYDLLWPDLDALSLSQDQAYPFRHGDPSSLASAAASFDDRGALDIQSPRDIRIIVAQDGNLLQQAKILYDTHPPPPLPVVRLGSPTECKGSAQVQDQQPKVLTNRTNTLSETSPKAKHSRMFSFGRFTQASPLAQSSLAHATPENPGAFGSPKHGRTNARPATSDGETLQNRLAQEGREEVDALLGCMFGSTGLPLISGTKLHIRPSRASGSKAIPPGDTYPVPPEPPFQTHARRRTPLTRSTTADNLNHTSSSAPTERVEMHVPQPRSAFVMITRLFTVDLSECVALRKASDQEQGPLTESGTPHQDTRTTRRTSSVSEPPAARKYKCPAYALSVMLHLPSAPRQGWASTPQIMSPVSPDQWGLSTDSQWQEAKASYRAQVGADGDIEQIVMQWPLLARLMTSLESILQKKVLGLLGIAEICSSYMPRNIVRRTSDESKSPLKRAKQPTPRTIQLPADALQKCEDAHREISRFGQRIALVLRTRRVVTGQNRWAVWRDEARLLEKRAGKRDQNFFFYNLLTAFLGFHLDWLKSLEGTRLRGFLRESEKRKPASFISQQQTVIVSSNKMDARRLIFLLSTFLQCSAPQGQDAMILPRSSRVGSSVSQSPPSGIPILRELSLRRTINRRQRGNRASTLHRRSSSFAGEDVAKHEDQAFPTRSAQHSRRASTARSILTPTLLSGENTRKSSTTTTSTVVPEMVVPVAHFSTITREESKGTSPTPRPGSSGSLASVSVSLQHTLQRSESNEQSNASTTSQSLGRWGSVMSGFWSNRRESSTEGSDSFSPTAEGLGISGVSKMPGQTSSAGTLEKMVEEAAAVSQSKRKSVTIENSPPKVASFIVDHPSPSQGNATHEIGTSGTPATEARAIPERPKEDIFPIKLSVDDNDGIIDVDLPISNSCASSFGSSVGSASHSHTAPSSFNDRSSIFTPSPSKERSRRAPDSVTDVAGYLKDYSPDFVLQAVKPYDGLKKDITEAMRADASSDPATKRVAESSEETWRDVRSTLIADTTTFSITRVCYQQRFKPQPHPGDSTSSPAMEDRIFEEPIMDHDPILIDAVERILAQSGHSSRVPSRAPSPSSSRQPLENNNNKSATKSKPNDPHHHHHLLQSSTDTNNKHDAQQQHHHHTPSLEVPRHECRNLVFAALEEVVRSVQAEQQQQAGGGERGARLLSGEPVRSRSGRRVGGELEGGEEEEKMMMSQDSTLKEGVRRWYRGGGSVVVGY